MHDNRTPDQRGQTGQVGISCGWPLSVTTSQMTSSFERLFTNELPAQVRILPSSVFTQPSPQIIYLLEGLFYAKFSDWNWEMMRVSPTQWKRGSDMQNKSPCEVVSSVVQICFEKSYE